MDKQVSLNIINTNNQINSQLAVQNKRKEKARIAARARRNQEANIIMEMANELNIMQEKMRRIDKATIVKLAIDYIKAFDILCRYNSNPGVNINIDNQLSINGSVQEELLIGGEENGKVIERVKEEVCLYPMPKLSTSLIFTPKTQDMDLNFLMINEQDGKQSFVLKPDDEVLDEDDLTHLAPQAGEGSISLEVEPLDGIELDTSLFLANTPPASLSSKSHSSSASSSSSSLATKTSFPSTPCNQKTIQSNETRVYKYICPN